MSQETAATIVEGVMLTMIIAMFVAINVVILIDYLTFMGL